MTVKIELLSNSQIENAKAVITGGCFEFFGHAPAEFGDMDRISSQYVAPSGIFLVLMDDLRLVGTGAIRCLDEQTCELKRMWFLPAYRGKGYGTKISELLLSSRVPQATGECGSTPRPCWRPQTGFSSVWGSTRLNGTTMDPAPHLWRSACE
jgi:putative acetyltransferase